jgi:hypothetical protein
MLRLVVVLMAFCLCGLPLAGWAGEINTVKGQSEQPFTAVVPAPDMDKMQELDRQIEEALKEQGLAPVVPPAALGPQDNQEDKPDGYDK